MHPSDGTVCDLSREETLVSESLLPGFRLTVGEVFKRLAVPILHLLVTRTMADIHLNLARLFRDPMP